MESVTILQVRLAISLPNWPSSSALRIAATWTGCSLLDGYVRPDVIKELLLCDHLTWTLGKVDQDAKGLSPSGSTAPLAAAPSPCSKAQRGRTADFRQNRQPWLSTKTSCTFPSCAAKIIKPKRVLDRRSLVSAVRAQPCQRDQHKAITSGMQIPKCMALPSR